MNTMAQLFKVGLLSTDTACILIFV